MVGPFLADHPIRSAYPWGTRKRQLFTSDILSQDSRNIDG